MTMEEVMEHYPSYADWCRTTLMEEKNTSWRLRRFVFFMEKFKAQRQLQRGMGDAGATNLEKPNSKMPATNRKVHKAAQPDGYIKGHQNFEQDQPGLNGSEMSFALVSTGQPSSHASGKEPGQPSSMSSGPMDPEKDEIRRLKKELSQAPGTSVPAEDEEGNLISLDGEQALLLGKVWQPARNPFGQVWQTLVREGRPLLMEVGCYEDSVLSREVISRFGEGSALRCGLFNGCDLETCSGVKHTW